MRIAAIASQLLQLAIALLLAPLLVGWVNQCRAWLSNRSAPPLLLPYYTIRKLFLKDAVVAEGASAIFRTTPYIVFAAMCCAANWNSKSMRLDKSPNLKLKCRRQKLRCSRLVPLATPHD